MARANSARKILDEGPYFIGGLDIAVAEPKFLDLLLAVWRKRRHLMASAIDAVQLHSHPAVAVHPFDKPDARRIRALTMRNVPAVLLAAAVLYSPVFHRLRHCQKTADGGQP